MKIILKKTKTNQADKSFTEKRDSKTTTGQGMIR